MDTAPATGPVGRLGRPSASDPRRVGSFLSLGRPTCASVCGVLGHLAPVCRCARLVCCVACATSWATWLPFTGVPARCVALCVRCPGPLGSCSPVRPLGALLCSCGVLGHLAPVHRCARVVCCVACAVSLATRLPVTGAPARCVALLVRCPGPLGSCSPMCLLGVLCCVCGVLGHLARVHRCARSVCCVACAVFWAIRLLFTGVPARCVVLCCECAVLGHLAPVHRCACSVLCFACAVSWGTWLLFTGVPARCVLLRVRCPGQLGSCSPVRPLGALLCLCGVLGPLAPVHRCACSVCCVACAVSWATWLLVTGVPARCVVLRVRCPGPPGSCSPVCPLGVLCCVCGVLGHLGPVHRCARSVCCVACAVSCATWLLLTDVPARCVVLRVRCPGPLGSCPAVCPFGVLCCVYGVLGPLAPVHRCARSVFCVACAVSWATWLLFTSVPARRVVLRVRCPGPLAPVHRCARLVGLLRVRCPGPLGSCSPVCSLAVLCCVARTVSWAPWLLFTGVLAWWACCVCGVLGHLAPVHRCARSLCCVVLRVRCPGPLGSCSPVCSLGVRRWVCGVLGHLAPVHRCARSVCCAVGCVCGASLRGAHSSIRTAAIRSRQGLGTLRARTRPSRRRLLHSRQGLGTLRAHTRPSGQRLFRSRQGLGLLPGTHSSVRTAAGVAWHRFSCRGSLRAVRALRVCGTRRPLLLGTCPCALVVAIGVPLWRASWLRVVRRASSGPVALGAPVGFPDAVVPFPLLGRCTEHAEARRERGSSCLPLTPAEAGALGSLRVVPLRGPAMGLSLAGPSGVGLWLRALRWLACVDPVTHASGFPYRPWKGRWDCMQIVKCKAFQANLSKKKPWSDTKMDGV